MECETIRNYEKDGAVYSTVIGLNIYILLPDLENTLGFPMSCLRKLISAIDARIFLYNKV